MALPYCRINQPLVNIEGGKTYAIFRLRGGCRRDTWKMIVVTYMFYDSSYTATRMALELTSFFRYTVTDCKIISPE